MCTVTSQCPGLTLLRLDIYRFAVIYLSFLSGWPEIVDNFVRYKFRYRPLESQKQWEEFAFVFFFLGRSKTILFYTTRLPKREGGLDSWIANRLRKLLHLASSHQIFAQPIKPNATMINNTRSFSKPISFLHTITNSFFSAGNSPETYFFSLRILHPFSFSFSYFLSSIQLTPFFPRKVGGGCNCMTWP